MDEKTYVDQDRLKPGFKFNEALARAICESVCMIVVYSPRYERHPYCLREFTAMERIEQKRRTQLGAAGHECGFIIPVVFGGDIKDLPPRIKETIHCCDFSKFTLASTEISRNPDFIKDIEAICKVIYELYKSFESIEPNHPDEIDCLSFMMPKLDELPPWRAAVPPQAQPLPFRGANK